MVKISGFTASVWVEEGNYHVKVDLTDLLKELFFSDPKTAKKVVLKGLKAKRREYIKELEDLRQLRKKVQVIYNALDKTMASPELQKELLKYPPKERREVRKWIKRAVESANDELEYFDYEMESIISRLNRLRKAIEIVENTDPDLLDIKFEDGG